jgi:5'-3' exonuclease
MTETPVVLIDLSSIAYPIWHMAQDDPNPNAVAIRTVEKVRALASGQPYVAICVDTGKSFRAEIDATYKANRKSDDRAVLQHQIDTAIETLTGDGFPVWGVKGFEADDLIATATAQAIPSGRPVIIASADKDLLQLVNGQVSAKSLKDGSLLDAEAVWTKFGVPPNQMGDYLALVGDKADNIIGAKGIGEKRAAELLARFGTLDALYEKLDHGATTDLGLTPAIATALKDFQPRYPTVRSLIALRTDAPIPFETIYAPRVPKDAATLEDAEMPDMPDTPETDDTPETPHHAPSTNGHDHGAPQTALAVHQPEVLRAPMAWERELEPRSMREVRVLAEDMFKSRLFSAYGTPHAVLSTIMAGRELGMQSMASLRAFHLIDNKPTLPADLIRALVIRSGKAKYFRCTERTATKATFETQRGDDPPIALTYTIEEGRQAWQKDQKAFEASGYGKNPADLLVARSSSKLARLVYPDVVHGLYSTEEFDV